MANPTSLAQANSKVIPLKQTKFWGDPIVKS